MLNFNLTNTASKKPEIFITSDPNTNKLTFSISNDSDSSINLTGGNAIEDGKTGPSSFYLYLGSLLSSDEIKKVKIQKDGWNVQYFDSKGDGAYIALCPSQNTTLASKQSITFELTQILASGQAKSGFLNIDYTNISGISPGSEQLKLLLTNPEDTQKKELKLLSSFISGNQVFITKDTTIPISNNLVFSLSNPDSTKPLVSQQSSAKPTFIMSFVSGNGSGALASAENVSKIDISIAQTYKDRWEKPQKNDDDKNPQWIIYPKTQEILGIGESASISFSINNIISENNYPESSTLLYIQYTNIPGYNDGFITLPITKKLPNPGILSFSVSKPEISLGDAVELSWGTFAVSNLELSYKEAGERKVMSTGSGQIKLNQNKLALTPKEDTTYTLTAYGNNGNMITKNAQESVSVIQPPPSILSFTASPSDVCSSPITSTISWNVTNADYVIIDVLGSSQQNSRGSAMMEFSEPKTITLTAFGPNKQVTSTIKITRLPKFTSVEGMGNCGISWQTSCAEKVTISNYRGGVLSTKLSGSYDDPNSMQGTSHPFVLRAENSDGVVENVFLSQVLSPFNTGQLFGSIKDFEQAMGFNEDDNIIIVTPSPS